MRFLLFKASAAYPGIKIHDEMLRLWVERLAPIDFNRSLSNLNNHIDTSDFFPKIANVIGRDPEQYVDYQQLQLDTADRFSLMAADEREAVDCPADLLQAFKGASADD